MSTEHMRAIHARYTTPPERVGDIVRRATGHDVQRLRKIVAGYDSEVFEADTGRMAVVVKLRKPGDDDVAAEAWAMHKARLAGVPVADVLFVDRIDIAGEMRAVMVQSCLLGAPLGSVLRGDAPAQRARAFAQVGEALARLHSVRVGGFYQLSPEAVWDFPDWAAICAQSIADRREEMPYLEAAGFAADEIARMFDLLKRQAVELSCPQPSLLHGDLGLSHIFVDDDFRLTGLVDFADFQGGHPLGDIASLLGDESDVDVDVDALRSGYADERVFGAGFQRRLLLHRIGYQMGLAAHNAMGGMREELQVSCRALRQVLAEWRALTAD